MNSLKQSTVVFAALCGILASANGQVVNGTFDDPLSTGWTKTGDVEIQADNGGDRAAILLEPATGSLSSISQSFVLPGSTQILYFNYTFPYGPRVRNSTVPPDSLSVFLHSEDTTPATPLFTLQGWTGKSFLYKDTDGVTRINEDSLTIEGPMADKSYWARLDTSSITSNTNVKLDIGLAAGDNGVQSFATIDDVGIGCPADEWCCDGVTWGDPIDDGNPCTVDSCSDTIAGTALHDPLECCGNCMSGPYPVADIYFMMDASGSTTCGTPTCTVNPDPTDAWGWMKSWIDNVLDLYGDLEPRPRVALGLFAGGSIYATKTIVHRTSDYEAIRAAMYDPNFPKPNAGTPFATAIKEALYELVPTLEDGVTVDPNPNPNGEAQKYIILITDGWVNLWVENGSIHNCTDDPDGCSQCYSARLKAEEQAELASDNNVGIFVTRYLSPLEEGETRCTEGLDPVASVWLGGSENPPVEPKIATVPSFYFEHGPDDGTDDLLCEFVQIAQLIKCDDGIACTVDSCVQGVCVHDDSACTE